VGHAALDLHELVRRTEEGVAAWCILCARTAAGCEIVEVWDTPGLCNLFGLASGELHARSRCDGPPPLLTHPLHLLSRCLKALELFHNPSIAPSETLAMDGSMGEKEEVDYGGSSRRGNAESVGGSGGGGGVATRSSPPPPHEVEHECLFLKRGGLAADIAQRLITEWRKNMEVSQEMPQRMAEVNGNLSSSFSLLDRDPQLFFTPFLAKEILSIKHLATHPGLHNYSPVIISGRYVVGGGQGGIFSQISSSEAWNGSFVRPHLVEPPLSITPPPDDSRTASR